MKEKGGERTSDPLRLLERAMRDELVVGCRKNASLFAVPWSIEKRRGDSTPSRYRKRARQIAQQSRPHVINLIKREKPTDKGIIAYTN
jgi:hypothetical protein